MGLKSRKRVLLIGLCFFTVLVIAGLVVSNGSRFTAHAPAKETAIENAPVSTSTAKVAEADSQAQSEEAAVTHAFQTDSAEKQALWQDGRKVIFVQNEQLIYSTGTEAATEQTLYTWQAPSSSQTWLNGEYLLIGSQLIADADTDGANRGLWLVIRIADQPTLLSEQKIFFGPDDVLEMGSSADPQLFFVQCRNAETVSEYVLDPTRKQWEQVEGSGMDFQTGAVTRTAAVPYQLNAPRVIPLADESKVYVFMEPAGSIVYSTKPYPMARRYEGLEVLDAKLIPYLDDPTPQVLGRLRDQSGKEWISFLSSDSQLLQLDNRLWEGEWQALNGATFTRASADQLEVLQYEQGSDPAAAHPPSYRQFGTAGAKLVSAAQSLLTYELDDGKKRLLDWQDVVHSAVAPQEQVWATPLQESMDFTVKQEPRPSWDEVIRSHKAVSSKVEGLNTNATVPDELLAALDEVIREEDYAAAKTFRKFGSDWYVLVDRQLYAYRDGQMNLLGESPVTVVHEIGEGVSGHGALDFIRLDKGWIVADTEGSRVVKLDDQLQVAAELEVPQPYRLELHGNRLQVASYAKTLTTDTTLKKIRSVSQQSFQAASRGEQAAHDFWPDERYRDSKRGLTWYYLNGFLYQAQDRSGRYRAFYLGFNINARAHVHIIPFNGEVNVILDHRLERFDRGGKWLGTLPFPRGNPDGIHDRTPQGENSLVMDDASGSVYLVQGYRILRINLKEQAVEVSFGQNDADIGKLTPYKGKLYAVLHSNQADIDRHLQEGDAVTTNLNTEIVEIDPAKKDAVHRYIVEGYYDAVRVGRGSESAVHMDLIQYKAPN